MVYLFSEIFIPDVCCFGWFLLELGSFLRSISTLVVCGSNQFFGEVFVLKSEKHMWFVMMSYRR